jgi:hypothetical protein
MGSLTLSTTTDPLKDKVFEIAWDIAGKILAGEILTSEDESKLTQALSSHPTYKAQASGNTEYDGLKKAWYRW